jgi:hypothetical protein
MKKYLRAVTPAEVTPSTAALCAEIAPGVTPFYVDALPKAGEPVNECFHVVNRQVASAGGSAVIGWAIWELPTVFVEAEFHAVWVSPEGTYLDLAPKSTATQRIFFLPDVGKVYEGVPIDNVRRPVTGAPEVREFFLALEAKYELMNRGARAREHGQIKLVGAEAQEYHQIERDIATLGAQVIKLYPYLGPYSPCLCGSGKKAR